MEDSIISCIQNAIETERTKLKRLNIERNEVLNILYQARYVNASDIHRIEAQYTEKIENTSADIKAMEDHVQELMDDA